jgi:hypothetical protein
LHLLDAFARFADAGVWCYAVMESGWLGKQASRVKKNRLIKQSTMHTACVVGMQRGECTFYFELK